MTATFKVDGVKCTEKATFNVKDPPVEFPDVGGVDFDPPQTGLGKVDNPNSQIVMSDAFTGTTAGIVFKARVKIPAGFGFGTGEWYFGQLVNRNNIRKKQADQTCAKSDTGGFVNDNPWPYQAGADPASPPWSTGDGIGTVTDSPYNSFLDSDQIKRDATFKMYIMFKPASDPPAAGASAFVPLRRCNWFVFWCAELNAAWAIKSQGSGSAAWAVDRTHPQWTDYSTNHTNYVATTCPGAC